MFRRFNRWLDWQIKYHNDKKVAPEILARIRRERGLPPEGKTPLQTSRTNEQANSGVVLLFAEARRRRSETPFPS
ncbi:MAG: hypothetical protein AAGG11_13495 [Pseudomonadota bacterium]